MKNLYQIILLFSGNDLEEILDDEEAGDPSIFRNDSDSESSQEDKLSSASSVSSQKSSTSVLYKRNRRARRISTSSDSQEKTPKQIGTEVFFIFGSQ